MRMKMICNAILFVTIVMTLIAPATAQEPPPRTPILPAGLAMTNSGPVELPTGKMPHIVRALLTPPVPAPHESIVRQTPPIPELESGSIKRGGERFSDLKTYLHSQGISVQDLMDAASNWSLYVDQEFGYAIHVMFSGASGAE